MNDPSMKDLWSKYAASMLEQEMRWRNSPANVAFRELARQEWLAKPWWYRAKARSRVWIQRKREQLGEIIAGREFE